MPTETIVNLKCKLDRPKRTEFGFLFLLTQSIEADKFFCGKRKLTCKSIICFLVMSQTLNIDFMFFLVGLYGAIFAINVILSWKICLFEYRHTDMTHLEIASILFFKLTTDYEIKIMQHFGEIDFLFV